MQPIDIKCTAPEFRNLKCPYTGQELEVYMLVVPNQPPLFHIPGVNYSPSQPFSTSEMAYRMWNRVDGVEGLKTGHAITCAYTGKTLMIKSGSNGYYFTGGYDPRMFYPRNKFLRLVTSRDGKSPYDEDEVARIEAVPPDSKPIFKREYDTDPTDEALHIAADALQKHKDILPTQASTTVSMALPSKSKKSKK